MGFKISSSLDCNKGLEKNSKLVNKKTKLTTAKVNLNEKAKNWNIYLYSKLRYKVLALHFLNKSASKKIIDIFYRNLKNTLRLSKSTNREKINEILNIKDPKYIINMTIDSLQQTILTNIKTTS